MIFSCIRKLWHILEIKRKYQVIALIISMLIASIAEAISIGLLGPFLAIISSPENTLQIHGIHIEILIQKIFNHKVDVMFLSLIFCVSVGFSAFIRLSVLAFQTRLSYSIGKDINQMLFISIANRNYEKHISVNSSESISAITTKSNNFILFSIVPLFLITNSFLYLILLVALMLYINPILTLSSSILIITTYFLFWMITRRAVSTSAKNINYFQTNVVKIASELINSYRDAIVGGKRLYFVDLFCKSDAKLKEDQAKITLIGNFPRYIIESVVLIGMVIAISITTGTTGAIQIAELGVIALAAQKILPIVQQGYLNITYLRANINGATDILEPILSKEVGKNYEDEGPEFNIKQGVELRMVSYEYPNGRIALNEINQKFEWQKIYGIKGSTGSGKTTLIDLVLGLIFPTNGGSVVAGGVVLNQSTARYWHRYISHVPQFIYLCDATVAENIAFGLPISQIDMDRVRHCARIAQIDDVISSWPMGYRTNVGESGVALSGGQKQRIGIARAIYEYSKVLILDEATSALDDLTEKTLMAAIHKELKDITVIMIAHRTSTLNNCDVIITLENGKVIVG